MMDIHVMVWSWHKEVGLDAKGKRLTERCVLGGYKGTTTGEGESKRRPCSVLTLTK